MKWYYVFMLVVCLNIKGSFTYILKNNTSEVTKGSNDKKGTIRIAGPWHSDSALDRNVDPGEDSYVKKIISSNEGLNFNKDMAEAGEMFDVNGIDDFYDKNALVTYEVNGHEIPVHLKPKYTPQSKSMFPEYIRETPAAMGLTRQPKEGNREGHRLQQKPSFQSVLESISGFTSKELPEYNVHDSPVLHEYSNRFQKAKDVGVQGFHSIHSSPVVNMHHELKLPWKAVLGTSRLDKINGYYKLGHTSENPNFQEKIKTDYKLKQNNDDASSKLHLSELIDQNHRVSEDEIKTFHHRGQDEHNIDQTRQSKEDEYHKEPDRRLDFGHNSDEHDNSFSKIEGRYNSHKDISRYLPDEDHRVPTADSDRSNLEHFMKNTNQDDQTHNDVGRGNSDTAALFEKLEDLHKNLASENQYHTAQSDNAREHQSSEEPITEEKEKAKVRILSLLGELTKKLHGMEAVVSGGHKIESFYNGKSETSEHDQETNKKEYEGETKSEPPFESKKLYNQHNNFDHEREFAEKDFAAPKTSESPVESKKLIERVSDFSYNDHDKAGRQDNEIDGNESELNEKQGEELQNPDKPVETSVPILDIPDQRIGEATYKERKNKDYLKSSDDRISEFVDRIRLDEENSAEDTALHSQRKTHQKYLKADDENEKILPETIEKFKEENKPFVMDTNAIDFEPTKEDRTAGNDDRDDDVTIEKPRKKSHKKHTYAKKENDEDEEPTKHHHKLNDKHSRYRSRNVKSHSKKISKERENDVEEEDESSGVESIDKITESLGTADDHDSGVARERSYRPKTGHLEDIEYPDYEDVKDGSIFESNLLRKRYHANKLNWADKLSDKAQQSAEKLAKRADFSIDHAESFKEQGENIALVKLSSLNVGKDAVDAWAREGKNYDFRSPLVTKKNSDFVQLMWKGDKEFGVGVAKSKTNDGWIVTSFYDSPYIDRFQDLKVNLQSENPVEDPYSDIVG